MLNTHDMRDWLSGCTGNGQVHSVLEGDVINARRPPCIITSHFRRHGQSALDRRAMCVSKRSTRWEHAARIQIPLPHYTRWGKARGGWTACTPQRHYFQGHHLQDAIFDCLERHIKRATARIQPALAKIVNEDHAFASARPLETGKRQFHGLCGARA